MFEHLSDPLEQAKDIAKLLSAGGWFYLELPNQFWQDMSTPRGMHEAWLSWLVKHPRMLHAADLFSTAARIKFGIVPPFGFVPMREHINFFTEESLVHLLNRAGFSVRWSGKNMIDCVCAVATRDVKEITIAA